MFIDQKVSKSIQKTLLRFVTFSVVFQYFFEFHESGEYIRETTEKDRKCGECQQLRSQDVAKYEKGKGSRISRNMVCFRT